MSKKNIILIQLPIPTFNFEKIRENEPLALGYLKCMAIQKGLTEYFNIEILSRNIIDTLGDAGIIENILNKNPYILGISCYCWNIERSLFIAKKLKEKLPTLIVIAGGPEITYDNIRAVSNPNLDIGVIGEGEETFVKLLEYFLGKIKYLSEISGIVYKDSQGKIKFTKKRTATLDLNEIPSPYISKVLDPSYDNFMALETVRGCSFKCTYCYYHKGFPKRSFLSLDKVKESINFAILNSVKEISFYDPTFNDRPDFEEFLKTIYEVNNKKKVSLSVEMRLDTITEIQANLLKECNVKIVEAGIQTINPKTLKLIKRRNEISKFVKGVHLLEERGIAVRVDVIIGLPGDTYSSIVETINFIKNEQLYKNIQIFNLYVLPGTELREKAPKFGILYEEIPPYPVIETKDLSKEEIKKIFQLCEDTFNISLIPTFIPPLTKPKKILSFPKIPTNYINKVIIDDNALSKIKEIDLKNVTSHLTNSFTLWFKVDSIDKKLNFIKDALKEFIEPNPYSNYDIVFESKKEFESNIMIELIKDINFPKRESFLNIYLGDTEFIYTIRIWFLFSKDFNNKEWLKNALTRYVIFFKVKLSSIKELKSNIKKYNNLLITSEEKNDKILIDNTLKTLLKLDINSEDVCFEDIKIERKWLKLSQSEVILRSENALFIG